MPRRVATARPRLLDFDGIMTPRLAASKRNASAGGRARAARTTLQQRQAWGEKAGAATLAKYGRDYYKFIRSKSKRHPVKPKE